MSDILLFAITSLKNFCLFFWKSKHEVIDYIFDNRITIKIITRSFYFISLIYFVLFYSFPMNFFEDKNLLEVRVDSALNHLFSCQTQTAQLVDLKKKYELYCVYLHIDRFLIAPYRISLHFYHLSIGNIF